MYFSLGMDYAMWKWHDGRYRRLRAKGEALVDPQITNPRYSLFFDAGELDRTAEDACKLESSYSISGRRLSYSDYLGCWATTS